MTFYLGAFFTLHRVTRCSPLLVSRFWSASWPGETPCAQFGLLSHGIFQDDFRCLIGSLVALAVKLHRNAPHCVSLISLIAGRYVVFIVVLGGIMKQNVKWCNYYIFFVLFSHFNVYCYAGAHFNNPWRQLQRSHEISAHFQNRPCVRPLLFSSYASW